MTPSSASGRSSVEPLPCHANPDQWFERADRTATLAACLACPSRRACARQAVACRPAWGMWAGIWIDGRFSAAAPLLRAIAEDHPPKSIRQQKRRSSPPAAPPDRLAASPTCVRCSDTDRVPARTLVFARSGGFCEIMVAECGLTADAIVSRVPSHGGGDPSTLFAVCQECAITVQRMDSQIVQRLGYRVEEAYSAATTPFFWRQRHRVCFDADGGLHPLSGRGTGESSGDTVDWRYTPDASSRSSRIQRSCIQYRIGDVLRP